MSTVILTELIVMLFQISIFLSFSSKTLGKYLSIQAFFHNSKFKVSNNEFNASWKKFSVSNGRSTFFGAIF